VGTDYTKRTIVVGNHLNKSTLEEVCSKS